MKALETPPRKLGGVMAVCRSLRDALECSTEGGVSTAVKFSLAGNTEATTAAVEKESAADTVLVLSQSSD